MFARNICQILFGKDISMTKISILDRKDPSEPMQEREVTLGYAADHVTLQVLKTLPLKFGNPLFKPLFNNFGYYLSLSSFEKAVDENCRRLRVCISELVQYRRSGIFKSDVEGEADLLTLFFASPDIFTDDVILDELLDFFIAASSAT